LVAVLASAVAATAAIAGTVERKNIHEDDGDYNDGTNTGGYRSLEMENLPHAIGCSTRLLEEGIHPRDVQRSAVAAKLSRLVYDVDELQGDKDEISSLMESHGFSDSTYFEEGIDAILATKHEDGYCLLGFRGTTKFQVLDWLSNLDANPVEYNGGDNNNLDNTTPTGCDLHSGYYESYVNFGFKSEVEEYLEDCTRDCPTCDVVLTGHSQGGAIAEIAALFSNDRYDGKSTPQPPFVISFGAPHALGAKCLEWLSEDERCRWYHYVMATKEGGLFGTGLVYDPVATLYSNTFLMFNDTENVIERTFARNGGIAYPGHMIIVSSEDPSSSYYGGFDGRFTIVTTDMTIDKTGDAHRYGLYETILEEQNDLYAAGNTTLPTHGFSVGSVCDTHQDMCGDGSVCLVNGLLDWETTCQQKQQTSVVDEAGSRGHDGNGSGSSRIRGGFFGLLLFPILSFVFNGYLIPF
jgi:hypothetical protein